MNERLARGQSNDEKEAKLPRRNQLKLVAGEREQVCPVGTTVKVDEIKKAFGGGDGNK